MSIDKLRTDIIVCNRRFSTFLAKTKSDVIMVKVQRIVLDVLKPHSPNGLDFSVQLAEKCPGCWFKFKVVEVDEKTETVIIIVESEDIPYDHVADAITSMGGSIHSIDEVEVTAADNSSSLTDA